ncbi:hypothetical protein LTR85_009748 [Meristemomyces frigidus]|nr:hypothetical protein LTR85_009748 [Meristemomyces frigidus]
MDEGTPSSSSASFNSPSTASSSPPQTDPTECWPLKPVTLRGRFFLVRPLQVGDAQDLWSLLADEQNARLFQQSYGRPSTSYVDFKVLMADRQHTSYGSVTYTVVSLQTSKAVGWVLLHSFTNIPLKSVEYALFITPRQRTESVMHVCLIMHHFLFEDMGYSNIVYRRGSQVEMSGQGADRLGFSLVDVMRRQMLSKDLSSFTDCYSIAKDRFSGAETAVEAYLDSHPIVFPGDG